MSLHIEAPDPGDLLCTTCWRVLPESTNPTRQRSALVASIANQDQSGREAGWIGSQRERGHGMLDASPLGGHNDQ